MTTILTVLNRLKQVNIRQEVPKIIQQTGYEYTALLINQQYNGINSEGNKITPKYRSKYYAFKKFNLNGSAGYGTPDLRLTGNMHNRLGISIKNYSTFEVRSTVEYFPRLEKRYGETSFKLNRANRAKYIQGEFSKNLNAYLSRTTKLL